jgi:DNA end-binding protein Ku
MPRGLWKGAISFGLVNVPVELFSAEKRAAGLDLAMLDKRDLAPVGYKRYNKATGREVPWGEIVKGYEYEDGKYVVLSDEDFRRANVDASRTIEILAFVELEDIPPQFFETPYYLKPGKRGEKAYALLRETLRKAGKAGIATVVIRTRQYLAALIPQDEVLLLTTLRYADELREPKDLDLDSLKKTKVAPKEMDLALRLVEDMADKWQPGKYKDTYREDLLKRVEEKVKKGQTEELTAPAKGEARAGKGAEVIDLMALLKKSVEGKNAGGRASTVQAEKHVRRQPARKRRAA